MNNEIKKLPIDYIRNNKISVRKLRKILKKITWKLLNPKMLAPV